MSSTTPAIAISTSAITPICPSSLLGDELIDSLETGTDEQVLVLVLDRKRRLEPAPRRCHCGVGGLPFEPVAQTADHEERVMRAVGERARQPLAGEVAAHGVVHAGRQPQLGRHQRHRPAESSRGDADDGEITLIQPNRLAEDVRRRAQPPPRHVAEDRDGNVGARPRFFLGEPAAERRRHAERAEEVRRHDLDERASRLGPFGDADHRRHVRRERGKDVLLRAQIVVVRERERPEPAGFLAVLAEEADHAFGVAEPRLERQRIDEAEHRRVGADAEADDERGDEGEAGLAPEQPQTVAQVLPEGAHGEVRRKEWADCFGPRPWGTSTRPARAA